ncbi:ribosome rescue GTPase HflX [Thiohalomonas denitrificans]|uniref:ribosome rescue GTPase HflX n=1 Tax=Thiohalomonas denitrificans TaxID=415747 RepID=UPI0026F1D1AE|nr:ribosome rescue GTPase HflX [Thiohalomonas denitrificans]
MLERPTGGERAVLVHLDLLPESEREDLEEFEELVVSAGAQPVSVVTGSRRQPEPRYFVGSGKAEEIRDRAEREEADIVLVNHPLSPSQERNLERLVQCRVLDRTGLILDIFAQRARSHEGKLQVELAQLQHLSTRLVRGWSHLERQKGGIGLRGPGETQLESDRRMLGERIKSLHRRLEKVRRQREQSRRGRRRAEIPTVSLVGYTNAGKSTLFNGLTTDTVYVADQLFATLDPTLRRLPLPGGDAVVLADTVGFIRHLPHDLVEAFRSTLQETRDADLLLHVIDASDDDRQAKVEQVNEVLAEIGADKVPQIEVYNKIDLLPKSRPRVTSDAEGHVRRVYLSAAQGTGMEGMLEALDEHFRHYRERRSLRIPPEAGRLRARLYEAGAVREESVDNSSGDWLLEVEIEPQILDYLRKQEEFAVLLPPA